MTDFQRRLVLILQISHVVLLTSAAHNGYGCTINLADLAASFLVPARQLAYVQEKTHYSDSDSAGQQKLLQ